MSDQSQPSYGGTPADPYAAQAPSQPQPEQAVQYPVDQYGAQYPAQPYAQQPYAQPYAQQPYAQPYGYGYSYTPAPPTNQMAVISLVLGIVGIVMIPILASIPAIITGHVSRRQIRERGEGGDGMALAGLICGYLGTFGWLALFLLILLPIILVGASAATVG